MPTKKNILNIAKSVIDTETTSISQLKSRLTSCFSDAIELILSSEGRLIVAGVGKSANIATKIVATFNSTGQPSVFMHAADALHGDLGNIQKNDVLGQYLCAGRPFDTADSALEYAHLSDKATPYQPEVNLSKFSTSFMDTYDFEPILKGVLFFMGVLLAFSIVMLIFSIIGVDPLSLISN